MELQELITQLAAVSDETWSAFQFARDPLQKKISPEEQQLMSREAFVSGQAAARKISKQFPNKTVQEILEELKVTVVHQQEEQIGSRLLFALYDSSRGILLMDRPLEKFLDSTQDQLFTRTKLESLILSHELYHHIESHDSNSYTQNKKIVLWKFFGYQHRSTIRSLSEIAAMSFSKELNQTEFSPFMLDILLVWPYNQDQAIEMYQEVISYQRHNN
ncbi:hypothetical protein [Enterococcus sp. LJL90]